MCRSIASAVAGGLALLAALLLPGAPRAQAPLQVLDAELGAETLWFAPHRWQGRAAVSAYTRREATAPGGSADARAEPELAVQLAVLDATGWHAVGRWALPAETRHVEPLRLPGGRAGWLLLVAGQWQVALPQGPELQRSPLCACETIFAHGGGPDPEEHRFAQDLDGDGVDEVLLPYPEHLEAYRLGPPPLAPAPLWRARWQPDGAPLAPAGEAGAGFRLPRFDVVDVRGDGRPALLVVERERALLTALPDPPGPGGGVPAATPQAVPLAGLGPYGEKDRPLLLGTADMDGDGLLDLLHAKLIDYGSVLQQQNELRWYRGQVRDGRFTFAPPTAAMRSDAGSFAELAHLRRDGSRPLALLLATAEVSFGTIMKALASQSVTLRASVTPWQDGALAARPLAANQFTYRDLRTPGRRAMFLFADLNGDGWRDYLLNVNGGELTVFLSGGGANGGPAGLQQPSFVHPGLELPSKPERVLVTDLDGDGREELVLRYRGKYHGALGTKLRLVRLPAP